MVCSLKRQPLESDMTFKQINEQLATSRAAFDARKMSEVEHDIHFEMLVRRLAGEAKARVA
jgi:hypothetical protein